MEKGIAYFPGCSLKDTAKDFEASAQAVMTALGLPLVELPRWNCCGTVFSLTTDDLMHHVASVRNLIRTQEKGESELVAVCAMCFNTLKRVSLLVGKDPEALKKINAFLDEEVDYEGKVAVKHLLEVLRDRIGWETLAERVIHPLEDLKVVSYYGCTLVRPGEIAPDDPERPTLMQDLIEAVGATPVSFPFEGECCGSYQIVDRRDLVIERGFRILSAANRARADLIITACPLCQHNLDQAQQDLDTTGLLNGSIPILYFTQLLAVALGVEAGELPAAFLKDALARVDERGKVHGAK